MSLDDYRLARQWVDSHPEEASFVGERPPELVEMAERALGVRFPPSYGTFLRELGAGHVAAREFYGLIDGNFETSSIPNGIWLSLQEREDSALPDHLVIVYEEGDGSYLAIDTSQPANSNEHPIVTWIPGLSSPGDELETVARDFGELFRERVEEGLSDRGIELPSQ